MKQKLLASILIAAMLFSLVPTAAFAYEGEWINLELTYSVLTEPADGKNGTVKVVKPGNSTKYGGTSYTIPDTITHEEKTYDVTAIGEYAFENCRQLTSVIIGNKVTTIEKNAFSYTSIDKIFIPNSVTTVGDSVFNNCDSLTEISIGTGLTALGQSMFSNCDELVSVKIPYSVTSIGKEAFKSCSKLANVTIGNSVETIGENAFYNCAMTEIVIPDSVTLIEKNAFNNCNKLADVTIGNKVTTIGEGAFSNCAMTEIVIPDSVTTVGSTVFNNCDSLTDVTIGENVKTIGERAFYNCSSLQKIVIPDSVTTLGNNVFAACSQLKTIIILGNDKPDNIDNAYNKNVTTVKKGYLVTVVNGTGSGYYGKDDHVAITANTAADEHFVQWYGADSLTFVNNTAVTSADAAFSMPAQAVTVTATFAKHDYTEMGYDTDYHWSACICGLKQADTKEVHSFTNACDTFCNSEGCGYTRTIAHTPNADDGDCTTAILCSVCQTEVTAAKTHAFDNDCDTSCNSEGCGYTRTITHTPNADDGDCTTAILCSACQTELTAAKTHAFDNDCDTSCNNAGCTHTRAITHTPDTDDGDCTTEVKCIVCNRVAIPANVNHSATGTNVATCTAKAKCDVCGTAFGDLLAHNYQWVIDKAATQSEPGLQHEECTVCHDKRNEGTVIDKLPITPPTPTTSSSSEFTGVYNYPVTVSSNDNGSAILSDSNAVEGESVTITTKPNSGYGAADVIVIDEDGNVIPVTDLGNGQYEFTMPDCEVNIEVVYKPAITMVIDSVYINVFGKNIKNDVAPIIVGDRTMLPIRVVAEALGADVDWDAETQKVTITKGDTVIELFIGETTAYVNGEPVQLDVAPFIDSNRTYLPVRFVSEYLGAVVHWDAVTRTVTVIPE